MRIAICEDNEEHLEILEEMVKSWAEKEGKPVAVGRCRSAEQFLFCMKDEPHYDLVFLDIQMSKINGLQLAKMIREDEVFQALTKVGQMMEDRKKEAIIVKRGDDSCRIFRDDIYYFVDSISCLWAAPLQRTLLRTVRHCSSRLMSCQVSPATSPSLRPVK